MRGKHEQRRKRSPLRLFATVPAAALLLVAVCTIHTAQAPADNEAETPTVTHIATAAIFPATTPEPTAQPLPAAEKSDNWEPDETEVAYIAKTLFGEASVVPSTARRAAVGWCILNRVDSPDFPDNIADVVTAPAQFIGYDPDAEPPEEYMELARDILTRYHREREGEADVGRTLPQGWCYFTGDGRENYFTDAWGAGATVWDWTLPNPYDN